MQEVPGEIGADLTTILGSLSIAGEVKIDLLDFIDRENCVR